MKILKTLIVFIILISLVIGLTWVVFYYQQKGVSFYPNEKIDSFEECVEAGNPIMESYPEQCRAPDGKIFIKVIDLNLGKFGQQVKLSIGEKVLFQDGLSVSLLSINDSRCKEGVICIWAGELSPNFSITGGFLKEGKQEFRLGESTQLSINRNSYLFILNSATENTATITVSSEENKPACTQEAKLCSDGSYVGRTGPNCEFAPCPRESTVGKCYIGGCSNEVCSENPDVVSICLYKEEYVCYKNAKCEKQSNGQCGWTQTPELIQCINDARNGVIKKVVIKEGQREEHFLLQKVYVDYVMGLNYAEYPISTDQGYSVSLKIGEIVSNGCTITLTLTGISGKTAYFDKKIDYNKPCPICLSEGTLIDTPRGEIAVEEIKEGMVVWTADKNGIKIESIISKTYKTHVSDSHYMYHLVFADGRELLISPGHPLTTGKPIINLKKGDMYNNSKIISAELIKYNNLFTYDILPLGDTGFYFANGILIDSTLH